LTFSNPLKKILLNKTDAKRLLVDLQLVPLSHKEAVWPLAKFTLLTDKIARTQAPALQAMMGFGDPKSSLQRTEDTKIASRDRWH
jgi:hypothetical protein